MLQTRFYSKKEKLIVELIVVFLLAFILFGAVQFSTKGIVGIDGFYHIKYSYIIRTEGFSRDFPYWQYSVFNDGFADEYLIYHALLVPLTLLDLLFAAKISTLFFAASMLTLFYFILKKLSIKYPLFWTFSIPLVSSTFLYRINFPRAITFSTILMLSAYYFCTKRNYWALFATSSIFMWSFPGFHFIILIIGSFMIADFLTKRTFDKKLLLYGLGGLLAGFIINLYFPNNIYVTYTHSFHMVWNILSGITLSTQTESNAPSLSSLIKNSLLIFVYFMIGLFSFVSLKKKNWSEFIPIFIISLFFMILSFMMIRSIDYFVPWGILFSAIMISRLLDQKKIAKKTVLFFMIILIFLFPIFLKNFSSAINQIENVKDPVRFKQCALWLADNTPEKSIVFHSSWDNFAELFFYNNRNYYLFSLAPDFLYVYNLGLYNTWDDIRNGKIENPSDVILTKFNSSYVFVDKRYGKFEEVLKKDPKATHAFSSEECSIYSIG